MANMIPRKSYFGYVKGKIVVYDVMMCKYVYKF